MNLLFTESEIKAAIRTIANIINKQKHDKPPVFICVLNGAFMFFSDLVKCIDYDCEIDFIRAKSYEDINQGEIMILKDIERSLEDKDVYVVDDICDSGNTLQYIINHINNYNKPLSITPVTLFKKHNIEFNQLIYGIELKDETFIYGFGLDGKKGLYRNLPYIMGEENDMN